MEGTDYGQLKDLISDRSRWKQDSMWQSMSETCCEQQKTKREIYTIYLFKIFINCQFFQRDITSSNWNSGNLLWAG